MTNAELAFIYTVFQNISKVFSIIKARFSSKCNYFENTMPKWRF